MKVKGLKLGDVFRILDHHYYGPDRHFVRDRQYARPVSDLHARDIPLGNLADNRVEVVRPADSSPIRRFNHLLILAGGDVVLEYLGAWRVHRCEPGEKITTFILSASSLSASQVKVPTADTALGFVIAEGSKHLGRPPGSMILAYGGRAYARATGQEVTGKRTHGGYKRIVKVDGVLRLTIAGVLTLPGEPALYDIIQDHFGPTAAAH
jgi:hypothetical protein